MNEENDISFFSIIGSLLHHPWLFFCPLVIIATISFVVIANMPPFYESMAVLSFESPGSSIIEDKPNLSQVAIDVKTTQMRIEIIDGTLFGDNIRNIIGKAWPQLKETDNPSLYARIAGDLRKPKTGIIMNYDKKNPKTVSISYKSGDPVVCYKVVDAAIDALRMEYKKNRKKERDAGLSFLKRQLSLYKNRLRSVDPTIGKIKTELMAKLPDLSEQERAQVQDLISDANIQISTAAQQQPQAPKYGEMMAEVSLQLLEAEKKRDALKYNIANGTYINKFASAKNLEEDPYISKYLEVIADKQLALAGLLSQGYMPEHPDIKKLKKEISDLNELKMARTQELVSGNPQLSEDEKKIATDSAKNELLEVESQIETLNDKMNLLRGYQNNSRAEIDITALRSKGISSLVEKLRELINEKQINLTYYAELRKELEAAQIKNRAQEDRETKSTITIIEEPKIPARPLPSQKPTRMLFGLIFALGTGVGLAYAADVIKQSVRTSSELRELLGIPVLATINRINTAQEIKLRKTRAEAILIGLFIFVITSNFTVMFIMKILNLRNSNYLF